jgi:hypothetical protein
MPAEDVAQALILFDREPEVRRRVADGDLEALGPLNLTVEEQRLVSEATPVLPLNHPSKVRVPVGGEVEAHGAQPRYCPAGTARAIEYVQHGLSDPVVGAEFEGWRRAIPDELP